MPNVVRLYRALTLAAALAPAAAACAQEGTAARDRAAAHAAKPDLKAAIQGGTIDPGMTREQVVERLGEPASVRAQGKFTYLFYHNGCERTCGMSDLVVLDDGRVTDAIFRAPERHYTGASSSPVEKRGAPRGGKLRVDVPSAEDETPSRPPARVTGVEIRTSPSPPAAAAADAPPDDAVAPAADAPRDSTRPPD